MRKDYRAMLRDNAVTILFVVLCILSILCSGQSLSYVAYELSGRLARNAFIALALIIPIVAGMGINFAITIGAMAAQIAALWVTEWQIQGLGGFLLAALMIVPIAALFGFLIGKLLNKMKGQEMIGGMILGYFANGLYQLLFLFIFGNLIPLHTNGLVIKGSTGVANTIELQRHQVRAGRHLAHGLQLRAVPVRRSGGALLHREAAGQEGRQTQADGRLADRHRCGGRAVSDSGHQGHLLHAFSVPMVTLIVIALLCMFNIGIMRTRLGQQFRAVGQSMTGCECFGHQCGSRARDRDHAFYGARRLGPADLRAELRRVPDLRRA